jgi:hypothetical protein
MYDDDDDDVSPLVCPNQVLNMCSNIGDGVVVNTDIFCCVKDLPDKGPSATEVTMVYKRCYWQKTDNGQPTRAMVVAIRGKSITHIGDGITAPDLATSNPWACMVNCTLDCCCAHLLPKPKECVPEVPVVVPLECYAVSICENQAQLEQACAGISPTYRPRLAHAFESSCVPDQVDDADRLFYLVCNLKAVTGRNLVGGGLVVKYLSDRNYPLFLPAMMQETSDGSGYNYVVNIYIPDGYDPVNARCLPSGGGAGGGGGDILHAMLASKATPPLASGLCAAVASVFHDNPRTGHRVTLWVPLVNGMLGCLESDRIAYEKVDQLYFNGAGDQLANVVVGDEGGPAVIESLDIGKTGGGYKMYIKIDGCRDNFNVCIPFTG